MGKAGAAFSDQIAALQADGAQKFRALPAKQWKLSRSQRPSPARMPFSPRPQARRTICRLDVLGSVSAKLSDMSKSSVSGPGEHPLLLSPSLGKNQGRLKEKNSGATLPLNCQPTTFAIIPCASFASPLIC
jgi:hypothetical protein